MNDQTQIAPSPPTAAPKPRSVITRNISLFPAEDKILQAANKASGNRNISATLREILREWKQLKRAGSAAESRVPAQEG